MKVQLIFSQNMVSCEAAFFHMCQLLQPLHLILYWHLLWCLDKMHTLFLTGLPFLFSISIFVVSSSCRSLPRPQFLCLVDPYPDHGGLSLTPETPTWQCEAVKKPPPPIFSSSKESTNVLARLPGESHFLPLSEQTQLTCSMLPLGSGRLLWL